MKGNSIWTGVWKDDKGRFVRCYGEETEGITTGYFLDRAAQDSETQFYRDGTNEVDGSQLMERKRGEEKGWPK